MVQSLDGLHIMLLNGLIVIHLPEWIEFNSNLMLVNGLIVIHLPEWMEFNSNTIEFSIRVRFCYFFVCMEKESNRKCRTLKIIHTII